MSVLILVLVLEPCVLVLVIVLALCVLETSLLIWHLSLTKM